MTDPFLYVTTEQLQLGDLVVTHGMQVLLDTAPIVEQRQGSTVYAWVGTVTNADQICSKDALIRSFLRGGNAYPGRRDRWNVQGNHLARWTVLRPSEGKKVA